MPWQGLNDDKFQKKRRKVQAFLITPKLENANFVLPARLCSETERLHIRRTAEKAIWVWLAQRALGKLDLGCIAAQGIFSCDENGCHVLVPQGKPATAFLFELIARLQALATVPMIDVRAYAKWLTK